MTPEEIRAFFARRNEALARHDAAAIAAGYAEDCVVESPIAGTVKGRAAVAKVPDLFTTAFPDLGVEGHESCLSANREAAPAVLLERLLGAVHEFTIGAVQSDDLTALVLRYEGL